MKLNLCLELQGRATGIMAEVAETELDSHSKRGASRCRGEQPWLYCHQHVLPAQGRSVIHLLNTRDCHLRHGNATGALAFWRL
jgi:hypothetical protein